MSDGVFLTGGTGLLGRYLLRDLLQQGVSVTLLMRPSARPSPEDRLQAILTHWHEQGYSLPRPALVYGDVTQPGLGIAPEALRWVAQHCGRVLHSAASLTFHGKDRTRDPWLSNLGGMHNVLAFCRSTGIRELHHVSTAYVCGKRRGTVYEDQLDQSYGARNDYEESKFAVEQLLRHQDALDSVTVYRPAVIVGDSQTGYTSSYHGLYRYLQITSMLHSQARLDRDGRWHHPVRLMFSGDERHNLVPVDWVSAAIARLLVRPECQGRTYHLAPRQATLTRDIEGGLAEHFNYYGTSFVGHGGIPAGTFTEIESFFYQYISMHDLYLHTEPYFDCRNTERALPELPCPPIGVAAIRRLIDFGVRDLWGKRKNGHAAKGNGRKKPRGAAAGGAAAESAPVDWSGTAASAYALASRRRDEAGSTNTRMESSRIGAQRE